MSKETETDLARQLRAESQELKKRLDKVDAGLKSTIGDKTSFALTSQPLNVLDRPSRPRRVVMIDDDNDISQLLSHALRSIGHFVKTASNGIDGLVLIGEFRPDVAIIDLGLPDLNGYSLARKVRSALKDACPLLIAYTAYEGASVRAASLAAGFHLHAVKPVKLADMILLIQSAPTLGR